MRRVSSRESWQSQRRAGRFRSRLRSLHYRPAALLGLKDAAIKAGEGRNTWPHRDPSGGRCSGASKKAGRGARPFFRLVVAIRLEDELHTDPAREAGIKEVAHAVTGIVHAGTRGGGDV